MRLFCSICKEIFIPYSEVKVTDCGHLYHGSCISRWTKQHQTCPQCRTNIKQPFRVFFDVEKDNDADPSTLEHQIETLSDKLRESENANKNLRQENENYVRIMEGMKACALAFRKKNDILKTSVKALKEQMTSLSKQSQIVSSLENEVEMWKDKVTTLQRVENLIKGSVDEVNKMVETTPVTQLAVRQLCTYVGILKVQLSNNEAKNVALTKENKNLLKTLSEEKKNNSSKAEEIIKTLKNNYSALEKELHHTKKLLKEYKKKSEEENKPNASSVQELLKVPKKRQPVFDLDLDFLDDEVKKKADEKTSFDEFCGRKLRKPNSLEMGIDFLEGGRKNNDKIKSKEFSKTVSHWEELVCAGPSKTFGASLNKSKSICSAFTNCNDDKGLSRSSSQYAFDGLGGRKKIRLGGPTPKEEFEQIKKKDDKKSSAVVKNKTILEYCQLNKQLPF